ncbi:4944_t:CDS:2, partial [Scutellospora calospora]
IHITTNQMCTWEETFDKIKHKNVRDNIEKELEELLDSWVDKDWILLNENIIYEINYECNEFTDEISETESENLEEPYDDSDSEESEELEEIKTKPKKKKRKLDKKPTKKKRKLSKYNIFMRDEMKRLKKDSVALNKLFSMATKHWKESKNNF